MPAILMPESGRSIPALSENDQLLLDEAFERALASWEEGTALSVAELLPGRPDLADYADRVLALAQEVAVTGPPPAPTPDIPGYTILSELGRGAMGSVYLARQDRLGGRPVALKVLPAGAALSTRARERFQAEANAIARLRHPHVVTVYDVVREGTLLAFAMEPVDGPSLHDVIGHLASLGHNARAGDVKAFLGAGESALGEADYWVVIARIGAAIARALEAVHRAGLLHRDVKPSNILLRRDGTPLLSDFGLVRDPDSGVITREGFVGTPAYAPPEQLAGGLGAADARSDVYALGATLYHALALRAPFAGHAPGDLLKLAERGSPPLRSLLPHLPRDLETIVAKAMSPSARDRYATAGAMADDLERLLAERPITARRAGVVSRSLKLLRRNRQAFRGTVAGAVAALLLVGAGAMGFVVMPRWAQEAREQAWLALLDPRKTDSFANAAFWEMTFLGPPRINQQHALGALAEYEKALRWQPWDDRTGLERDVLAVMLSMGPDGRSPVRFTETLRRRAPLACGWLERWTRVGASELPPELPEGALPSSELTAMGLMSYLSAEMTRAVEAWLRLERQGDPGPLVRGGLGLYFVYKQEPGRGYPRLEHADRAFHNISFLRAAHAEAACGVGDVDLAALLLEQAGALPMRDEHQLLRVQTVVDLARGDVGGALGGLSTWFFGPPYGGNGVAGYQVGAWLIEHGDEDRAVRVMSIALGPGTPPKRPLPLFLALAERWWEGLGEEGRLRLVEEAIATRVVTVPWTAVKVPVAYHQAREAIRVQPYLAGLRPTLKECSLDECGRRLLAFFHGEPHDRQPGVALPPLPQGEELRRLAREVLGLDP